MFMIVITLQITGVSHDNGDRMVVMAMPGKFTMVLVRVLAMAPTMAIAMETI